MGLDDQFLQLGWNIGSNDEKSISKQCYFTILFVKWMPQMLIGFSTWWDESKTKYFKSTTWSTFTSSCPIGWNFDGAWLKSK